MIDNSKNPADITAWGLIKPYWVSEDRWKARGLLALVIAMNMTMVAANVWFNSWQRTFFDAIQQYNYPVFKYSLLQFTVIALALILLGSYRTYFRQMLEFRWRQWLTNRYLNDWLGDRAYYRIERDNLADNPDQRVSADLQGLASASLNLSLGLLSTTVTLFSFIVILWNLSGAFAFHMFGTEFSIPGYMVWAALIYAAVGSWVTHKVNHPLVSINYQQQRVEADFRFSLIRIRENADQIALYQGERSEEQQLKGVFSHIRENWRLIMRFTRRFNIVVISYSQLAIVFPYIAAAPKYFSKSISFGMYQQVTGAFGTVSDSFSWFINNYDSLAEWRATVNRLREFHRVMRSQHLHESVVEGTAHGGINVHVTDTDSIEVTNLRLQRPNGEPMANVGSFTIAPKTRWLVRGPSGAGKSTLMRTLAGLWPFGEGTIEKPADAKLLFIPQRSYLPIGTLKAALCYPSEASAYSDEACRDVLAVCRLPELAERLGESAHWERSLSPGEQQRLAAARALLQQPDFLFLDEATSALDPENESIIYNALIERLPNAAIVSVAHRKTLEAFHDHTLFIERAVEREAA
ncbi:MULTISPECIES: ABC transporter ATP-binding protein/permease [Paraburkholderia]|jgi:putative ATP-binding cassette transporter|uniref:ABC transporter ATP-binding protein n=1 Tax=Paraburkholderia caribensis TaxID=75105 RepID=A0A9Q6S0X3_9BURK|nr:MULTISPECIES: ABC transporter ATP-binding protein/permease [Paraburkholderia]AMV43891.1 ABC transporter ATP-binding protein [Paraburkholderia caribensis]MCO4878173.1 ABC transporter ATP-binding protein/permease [Paraburkholderia caribensis]PTB28256.1 ABC transporter ATP-binding protein/permease [Paraburkholderia caribensis]QLB62815.1 ABC transporter ATP-binding protein [Paraburkholderia caribensis]